MSMNWIRLGMAATVSLLLPIGVSAETVQLKLKGDRPVVEAGKAQTIRVKVAVEGGELPEADRPPVNLAIVIDKSGSMRGQRIAFARQGARDAVRRLGSEDIVSLVVFDHEVDTLVPAQRLENPATVKEAIDGITAGGSTNIHGGMMAGFEELEKHFDGDYMHRAVLLSDGRANVGPTQPEAFHKLGRMFAESEAVISTLGVGRNYNERLLADLAQGSDGNNYFVDQADALPAILEDEIGELIQTVARGVTITIELPDGVELERVLGRSHRQEGRALTIDFHNLSSGRSKYSVLELTVPEGQAEQVMDVLSARADYRRADNGQQEQRAGALRVRYTDSSTEADAAVDAQVQQAWVELQQAEIQDQVLDLVEQGDRDAARDRLRDATEQAEQLGLDAEASERMRAFHDREEAILDQRDYSRAEALQRRTDAYQRRHQQEVGRVSVDDPDAEPEGEAPAPQQRVPHRQGRER